MARLLVLPENRPAVLATRRVGRALLAGGRVEPLLTLHGPPGTGKTLVCQALLRRVGRSMSAVTAASVAARDLGDDPGGDPDLLIVEDIQHLTDAGVRLLPGLLDRRLGRRLPTVVTARRGPARLTQWPWRVTDRLAGGLVVGLGALGQQSRLQLAAELLHRRGLRVTEAVVGWVAGQADGGSARGVIGAVNRLAAVGREVPPPVDLPDVLRLLPASESDETPVGRILKRVAGHFAVPARGLLRRDRKRQTLWPRQVAIYLARRLTGLPLTQLGRAFGGLDAATVLHACRRVQADVEADPETARLVGGLEAELL